MNLPRIENIAFFQNCLIFFDIPNNPEEKNLMDYYMSSLHYILEFLKLKQISIFCLPIQKNSISKEYLEEIGKYLSKFFHTVIVDQIEIIHELKNKKDSIFLIHPKFFSFQWHDLSQLSFDHFIIHSYKFFYLFKKDSNFNKIDKNKFCISSEIAESFRLLENISSSQGKPKIGIFGGNQIEKTIKFLDLTVKKFQYILLGGSIGVTALKSMGVQIGSSPYEKDQLSQIFQIMNKANFEECKVELPLDHIVSESISIKAKTKISPREISNNYIAIDIGPKTISLYEQIIKQSNFVLFHSPTGIIELEKAQKGTWELLKIIQKQKKDCIITGNQLCNFVIEKNISLKIIPDFDFIYYFLNQNLSFLKAL